MEKKIGAYTIHVTNSDKILFPDGITKGQLIDYYERIAPIMLPHVAQRPVSMHRFPEGIGSEGFFHKDIPDFFPSWIDAITIKKDSQATTTYAIVNNEATLVYLANFGCITPHIWLSKVSQLAFPDLMIFDLDPGRQDFRFVCNVAQRLRKLLEKNDLLPFVKTSGSKGLHVTVPLVAKHSFDVVREIARNFAQQLVKDDPQHITLETRINKRRGRLFVDITRNAYAQTIAAPYSVRPKSGAPVATPVEWHELAKLSSSQHFTLKNIFRRLSKKEDPWLTMYQHGCSLKNLLIV